MKRMSRNSIETYVRIEEMRRCYVRDKALSLVEDIRRRDSKFGINYYFWFL